MPDELKREEEAFVIHEAESVELIVQKTPDLMEIIGKMTGRKVSGIGGVSKGDFFELRIDLAEDSLPIVKTISTSNTGEKNQ